MTEDKEGKCLRLKKRGLTTSGPVEGEGPLSLGGHAALPWVLEVWPQDGRGNIHAVQPPSLWCVVTAATENRPTPIESLPLPGGTSDHPRGKQASGSRRPADNPVVSLKKCSHTKTAC